MTDFVHLHLHTQYSLLDGAIRTSDLFPRLQEHEAQAVACTDHGNMFGALDFFTKAKKSGIKPIFGCESYIAAKDRRDKTSRKSYHLVLLAKDQEGYRNLNYLISMGFLEGFYYNPRIDKEILRAHSKGLFGLSACLGGEPAQHILAGNKEAARQSVLEYKEIFEPGSYFLEVQSNGYSEQVGVNEAYRELSETCGVPLVATGDCHYLDREDARAHEVLMCIQTGKTLADSRRLRHPTDSLYVRSPREMHQIFGEMGFSSAVENTVRIASECKVELDLGKLYLPKFPIPSGYTLESFLEEQARRGLDRRFEELPETIDHRTYRERLERELDIIQRMGFPGYFLIVWDFIRHAKEQGIPVGPGRGSGAGSLVAYALRITDIDPIFYGLLFERFLNPERVSMPDFDIDFCMNRREEVIQYVVQKYGRERVAQIAALGQLKARSVIKDVGRVLGLSFSETDRITKLIPPKFEGKDTTISKALEVEPRLIEVQRERPEYAEAIQIGQALEGLNRQAGVHAAGIVISEKPVWEHVPVCRVKENELVTQWNKDEIEKAGLVKFDFLGLKTLTVIDIAVRLVNQGRPGVEPLRLDRVALDDSKVFRMLAKGKTDGVFQMEGSGFTEMLKSLRPDRFHDLIAAVALYRPGPMESGMMDDYVNRKHGRAKITYPHPSCETVLRETYGVIVYQEQVMNIAVELCGYSLGQADLLRKLMGKKKPEEMAKQRERFVQGAVEKSGMAPAPASSLFDSVEKFAGYSFNKSHSAAYALVAYHTAYLKAHHPVEFMAALLTCDKNNTDKVSHYITAAKNLKIEVLPPDVNESEQDFSVVKERIRFGLGAVRNVGGAAVEAILEDRNVNGRFSDLFDFCTRVDLRRVNRRVIESLVKCGAFDSTGGRRAQMFASIDRALEIGQSAQKDRETGQASLFSLLGSDEPTAAAPRPSFPDLPEWPEKERLAFEKEALGFYITGHPLQRYARELKRYASTDTRGISELAHREVTVAGIVVGMRERTSKTGNRWAVIQLEDLAGEVEVLCFARVYEQAEQILKGDEPVLVRGTAIPEGDDDNPVIKIRADEVQLLSDLRLKKTSKLAVRVGVDDASPARLQRLKEIIETNRGSCDVFLCLTATEGSAILQLPAGLQAAPTEKLVAAIQETFGPGTIDLR